MTGAPESVPAAGRPVYGVREIGEKAVVTCNDRPVSIELPKDEAERIATRLAWSR